MKFEIIPYTEIDGIRTKTDSTILGMYDQMTKDGTDKVVFCHGWVNSRESFLKYMKDPGTWLYLLYSKGELVGFAGLDQIEGKTAFCHFCAFSNFWGKDTVELGKQTLRKLISMKFKNGEYVFDLFKGFTPVWNQLAIDYAVKCGGVNLGVVPNAVWNERENKSNDAAFIYYTREGLI